MRFLGEPSASNNGFALKAEADGRMDGYPPVNELRIDTPIQALPPAKLAIAGSIAFGDLVGTSVTVDKGIPRMTVDAIAGFFEDRQVRAEPVDDTPASVWPSSGALHIREYSAGFMPPEPKPGSAHNFFIQVADGSLFNGALSSAHHLILASNAKVLATLAPEMFPVERLQIAIAVLLSHDLHARGVHVTAASDAEFLQRCRWLLRSADMNLTWNERYKAV